MAATPWKFILVDEDGDLFGTNEKTIADKAYEQDFTRWESEKIPELTEEDLGADDEEDDV